MEIINKRESEPIKIGIPSNSRITEDCTPIADFLEFEKSTDGTLKSRFLPNTKVFPLRVRTIARFLRDQIFQFGILGDDTAVDEGLDEIGDRRNPDGRPSESSLILNPGSESCKTCKSTSEYILPELKCFSFKKLPATQLSLLLREEDAKQRRFSMKEGLVTSYPRATKKILKAPVVPEEGQLEFLVRSMPERFGGAVDIVRTGETARQFRLEPVQVLLESQPTLWRSLWRSLTGDCEMPFDRASALCDIRAALLERLKPLL